MEKGRRSSLKNEVGQQKGHNRNKVLAGLWFQVATIDVDGEEFDRLVEARERIEQYYRDITIYYRILCKIPSSLLLNFRDRTILEDIIIYGTDTAIKNETRRLSADRERKALLGDSTRQLRKYIISGDHRFGWRINPAPAHE